jgi:hypothetical protein
VVLVEMRKDRRVDVTRRVSECRELGSKRVLLADVEPGKTVVEESREPTGEVRVVGDRGAVLASVEQEEPL